MVVDDSLSLSLSSLSVLVDALSLGTGLVEDFCGANEVVVLLEATRRDLEVRVVSADDLGGAFLDCLGLERRSSKGTLDLRKFGMKREVVGKLRNGISLTYADHEENMSDTPL